MPSPLGYSSVSSAKLTTNVQVNSLLYGTYWTGSATTGTSLTYSFLSMNSYFARDYSGDQEFRSSYFLTSAQQNSITSALGTWSSVSNIKFTKVNDSVTNAGDLRFGGYMDMPDGFAAWGYFPSKTPSGGDVWIGPVTNDPNPVKGTYDYMTFMHEIGHALGLKHPFSPSATNSTVLSSQFDDVRYTIMSYNNNYSYEPTTPMLLDIAAIQSLYGANKQWQVGNNSYSWAADQSVFETIWDAGGVDTIDASNQAQAVRINLNEGQFSKIGATFQNLTTQTDFNEGLAIAYGTKIENAIGSANDDTLIGNALDNVLNGRAGADVMIGGSGNDTYVVDNINDVIQETSALNSGVDTVQASSSYVLSANIETLILTGFGNINGTGNALNNRITGTLGANVLDGGAGIDTLVGGTGNDTYVVDNLKDVISETSTLASEIDTVRASLTWSLGTNLENLTLTGSANLNGTGNALNNVLTGNAGNNLLDGLAGRDTLVGGAGNDTYTLDNAGDSVVELADEGIDLVRTAVSHTLSANVENAVLLGAAALNLTGNASNNSLIGNAAANVLNGMDGADILDGGAGIDTLIGGTGNDTYVVDNLKDVINETSTSALEIDSVRSSVSWTLGNNLENLTLTGVAAINGSGNALDNVLIGNAAANVLNGLGGADSLDGGAGNDTYYVDNLGDTVIERGAALTEIDSVVSSISYALGANLENLTLGGAGSINATGNALNNRITGNAGANILDGGLGIDTLVGGTGNDTYVVDNLKDVVSETSTLAAEVDSVRASVNWVLGANLENLTLTGSANLNGTGNALNNVLTGNAGNNLLDGLAGRDTLVGGAGNDTYTLDNAGDSVVELADEGIDLVRTAVSHTLSANVENAVLLGAAALNLTGNASNNSLIGNAAANVLNGMDGADTLDGGAGIDTLIGGTGNDTYVVDNLKDVISETSTSASEIDSVRSSVSWTLGSNLENLTLTGAAAINGSGNALDNVLIGNAAANVLNGLGGADSLDGGAGNDTYYVDNLGDTVIERGTALTEIDSVVSSISYVLGANLENLTLSGAGSINATGNALNNRITGNAGANILDGGLGIDTLVGGTGNDTYVVDNLKDVISETSTLAGEIDSVRASVNWALGANLENLTLTGSANLNGTGNALNNVLTGNAGNNLLDGLAGRDTLVGGAGNDTYTLDNAGDSVVELADEGIDLVRTAVSHTLSANVENAVLLGIAALNLTGNASNNSLIGNAAANVLNGMDGADTLDGGAGIDTLIGGTGNDTYVVDNLKDVISETSTSASEIDSVRSSVSWTLGSNLENLTLTGVAAINGSGNALDNVLIGNAAANVLNGGAGNDRLDGGAGNDTLIGGVGTDTLTGGVGADRFVFSSLSELGKDGTGDVILDFSRLQGDKIDLSKLDANALTPLFNKFSFVDAGDFTGAGQLRFVDHVLYGNVNDDLGADFEIQLVGVNTFNANDLVA
ncbi:M10 family metallopeptidase [Pseudomonas alvandae]|uniref:M10 family metallopeptidase n=1 Tax=Pseudomonas canavaninivorans TaxID=2842348 RepID=UPI00215FB4A5|nr:M10 family metallopeptidase [Pseudomonas canavaninivorans]UVM75064.1 matrixin family metalloprotease [Pseudomonas canavaninivorans]